MAGRFSAQGLAQEWDAVESIRARVREGGLLEQGPSNQDPTNKTAATNMEMLVPLLVRLQASALHLPSVTDLRSEVADFYNLNNREVTESQVDDTAWCCRRFVVFVKRKAQKRLVGLVLCLIKQYV